MSTSNEILFPPEEILNPPIGKNFNYIILWMLANNKYCTWSDFTEEISPSTLSGKLNTLIKKGYVIKSDRNHYKISQQGRTKLSKFSNPDEQFGKLRYPPQIFLKERNYDHWILWMVNNNPSCRWSDFLDKPLEINQSSLSKTLRTLMEDGFIINENKEYKITPEGTSEYLKILKLYDLDRQSILEEESKKIASITEKVVGFFNKYDIKNEDLKFRFLNLALKLDYRKVEDFLDEDDFSKVWLFLSLNHVSQYPDYISLGDFSVKYEIKESNLEFCIDKIIDEKFFNIKFFRIQDENDRIYYFYKNEPIEKILNAIVEKNITKFTYLNKFEENISNKELSIDVDLILDKILDDICENLFSNKLRASLKLFLPEYIKYLAYKIESEIKLINDDAKLEGLIWSNIFEEFRTFEFPKPLYVEDSNEAYYKLNPKILETLNVYHLSKLNYLKSKEFKEAYELNKIENLNEIENHLERGKISKALKLYETNNNDSGKIGNLILKDIFATSHNNFTESIQITTEIIRRNPDDYVGYLLQSMTLFLMDNYKDALERIEQGLEKDPHVNLEIQKAQILIKSQEHDLALEIIKNALLKHPNNIFLLRIKTLIHLCEWKFTDSIDTAIKLNPKDKELLILKSLLLCISENYKEAKKFLMKEIDFNIFKKKPDIDTDTFFILTFSYIGRGKFDKALKIANRVIDLYPKHPISYLTKALVLGYNFIFNFKLEIQDLEPFLRLINSAISLEFINSKKSRYLEFQSLILQGIGKLDDAIKTIENAIKIDPTQIDLHLTKIFILNSSQREDEAIEYIDHIIEQFPRQKGVLYTTKSFVYHKTKKYEEGLRFINEISKEFPNHKSLLNNKALFYANLDNKEEAIKSAEETIKLDPNDGNSYDSYGEILMKFKEYQKAIKNFEKAIEISPKGWFIFVTYLKMGNCYKEIGNYDTALEYYEKAKLLTERVVPLTKKLFVCEADKYISEIKELNKKVK